MIISRKVLLPVLFGFGTLSLSLAQSASAALVNYSVEYDPVSEISIFNNSLDSLAPLRTFSSIINPTALGGAFNPIWINPGDGIKFFADGSYSIINNPPSKPPAVETVYRNGGVPPDKTWRLEMITDGPWKKWIPDPKDPRKGSWEDHEGNPDDGSDIAKISNWYYFPGFSYVAFIDSKAEYGFKAGFRDGTTATKLHVGAEEKNGFIPPNPATLMSSQEIYLPAPPNFFEEDAPSVLLAEGFIEVPETDSLDFMSVYTPNAGAGSVATPEPSPFLSLLALGTLGAASTLKRKLKSSQSNEKETTKAS